MTSSPTRTDEASPVWRQALDNPWLMLVMLFFVTAALGLPFLWMSRGFSTLAKRVLTIVVLAYTVLILWAFSAFMIYMWQHYYAPYLQ
jgi:hypothetical protein